MAWWEWGVVIVGAIVLVVVEFWCDERERVDALYRGHP